MIRAPLRLAAILPLLAAACSSPPPAAPPAPTAAPTAEASAAPAPVADKPATALPTECHEKTGKLCLPPPDFVKRLCGGSFPDVALAMLAKGTPWSRAYLRVKVAEAWNASGGVSSGEKMFFDEEFVVLTRREAASGGMTVSGAGGGYDVLRWDGSCASLQDDEVTLNPSPTPKAAKVPWKLIDDKIQKAILSDEKVNKIYLDRRRECKGATMGDVSDKCVKLDDKFSAVLVDYVRKVGNLPAPSRLP